MRFLSNSFWEHRQRRRFAGSLAFLLLGFCIFGGPAHSQEEPLPGPDSHETGEGPHGHLFGDWGGERSRLQERGVKFDLQYVSDSLANIGGEKKSDLPAGTDFEEPWTSTLANLPVCKNCIFMRRRSGKAAAISEPTSGF